VDFFEEVLCVLTSVSFSARNMMSPMETTELQCIMVDINDTHCKYCG
jgi:hypothetical protein